MIPGKFILNSKSQIFVEIPGNHSVLSKKAMQVYYW